MDLVESYLVEVSQYLPAPQRKDILKELRSTLEDAVNDRAEEHNRLPNRDDEVAILEGYGHPMRVAGGYREQRYLIGPDLFPQYIQTLKTVFAIAFAAALIIGFSAAYLADWGFGVLDAVLSVLSILLWVVVMVTVVFASLEYSGEKLNWYDDWKPASLSDDTTSVIDRSDVVTNLVTEAVFLFWWNDILVFHNWLPMFGPEFPLSLADVWMQFYWPLNVLAGAALVLHLYVLVRGVWHRFGLIAEIAIDVALLAIIAVLLTEPVLIDVADVLGDSTWHIQISVKVVIGVIAAFTIWDITAALRQLRGMTATA